MGGNISLQSRLLQSYTHRLHHNNNSNNNNNDNHNNNDNDNQVCREANKIGRIVPHLTDLIWQSHQDYMVAVSPVTRWLQGWGGGGVRSVWDKVPPSTSKLCLHPWAAPTPCRHFFASPRRISEGLISLAGRLNLVRADNDVPSPLFFLAAESDSSFPARDSLWFFNTFSEGFWEAWNIFYLNYWSTFVPALLLNAKWPS